MVKTITYVTDHTCLFPFNFIHLANNVTKMKNKLCLLIICIFTLSAFTCTAQQFLNGDLEGTVTSSSILPQNWQNVPFDDINCQATHIGYDTPDLTDISGPGSSANGLLGNPYSGLTFVSGMYGGDIVNYYFQEGIMQTVSALEINHIYVINFHQSVVKQDNALDKSGSWAIYIDTVLAAITAPTHSEAPYNSISFIWESRNITFTATATSHLIKFLPVDDDTNGNFSMSDTTGALRLGIDAISLSSANGIKEYNPIFISVYPNPSNSTFAIQLPVQHSFLLSIIDITGRTVYTNKNATGTVTIDASSYNAGVYFVKAVNERTVLTGKLVKQ